VSSSTTGKQAKPQGISPLLAVFAIALGVYLSTPYLTSLSHLGVVDTSSTILALLALVFFIQLLPKYIGAALTTAVVLLVVTFNLGNKFYFEMQQTFVSTHTFYLISEMPALLRAVALWQLILGSVALIIGAMVVFKLVLSLSAIRLRNSMLAATIFCCGAVGVQIAYAKTVDERVSVVYDYSPVGFFVRSSGLVPFAPLDYELVLKKERDLTARRLLDDLERPLPRTMSIESIWASMGRRESGAIAAKHQRYPLLLEEGKQQSKLAPNGKNVIVVVMESMRANEMGAYGAKPHLILR